jgi:endo-beta-N-acetylglucosaminidase D
LNKIESLKPIEGAIERNQKSKIKNQKTKMNLTKTTPFRVNCSFYSPEKLLEWSPSQGI